MFYASPPVVARGEKTLLCFGVENAKVVRIEPEIEPVRPSPSRCLQFAPQRTAVYTLTATGESGMPATQSVTIQVTDRKAPAPARAPAAEGRMIELFTASAAETQPGRPVTLCYIVRGADSVRLEPGSGPLVRADKSCIAVTPQRTTTYILTATGGGKSDTEKVTIQVR